MLFQEFFADLGKPVVKAALGDSVQTEICDRRHAALAAVDDDLLPVCDFLLTDSGGIFAQNKFLPTNTGITDSRKSLDF